MKITPKKLWHYLGTNKNNLGTKKAPKIGAKLLQNKDL
jgi:hypothetical protein